MIPVVYFLGDFPMGGEILRDFGIMLIYDTMLFLRNLTVLYLNRGKPLNNVTY